MTSINEIIRELGALRQETVRRATWGRWKLDRTNFCLEHTGDSGGYYITLGDFTSSAQILDWIFQIQQKRWATGDDLVNLLGAIRDIFDPQGNYCSFGNDQERDPRKVAAEFLIGVNWRMV